MKVTRGEAICFVLCTGLLAGIWYLAYFCITGAEGYADGWKKCRDDFEPSLGRGTCNVTSIFAPTVGPDVDATGWIYCDNGLWSACVQIYTDRLPGSPRIIQGSAESPPACTVQAPRCSTVPVQIDRTRVLRADNSHVRRECFVPWSNPATIYLYVDQDIGDRCGKGPSDGYVVGAVFSVMFGAVGAVFWLFILLHACCCENHQAQADLEGYVEDEGIG